MMSDPDSSKRRIIESWQQSSADSGVVPSHGLQDIVVGGAILGMFLGAFIFLLARFGAANDSLPILVIAGALAGAVGCSLFGLLVGLIGQWLAARLGLERLSQPGAMARLRHSGLVGLLGGPLMVVLWRGFGVGVGSMIAAAVIGAIFWTLCGAVGGAIGAAFDRRQR